MKCENYIQNCWLAGLTVTEAANLYQKNYPATSPIHIRAAKEFLQKGFMYLDFTFRNSLTRNYLRDINPR